MNRKILLCILAAIFTFAFTLGAYHPTNVLATGSLEEKIKDIKNQQNEVKDEKNQANNKLNEIEQNQLTVESQIRDLDRQIEKIYSTIRSKKDNIVDTKHTISELKSKIKETEKRIGKRNEVLKKRLVVLQENGGKINYFSVLLGAESFGDFLSRATAVSAIMNADQDIMEQQKKDQAQLEESKVSVDRKLKLLEEDVVALDALQDKLAEQQEMKDAALNNLEKQGKNISDEILSLQEKERILKAQERAAKAELEEWKRQQAANEKPADGNYPPPTSGDFMRPANGPTTSEFGPRWGEFHSGIDIASGGKSNVPIVATADGTVIESYLSNSYGNVVFVTHNIRGQIFTSVYAHMQNRAVSPGQRVKKGQFLGYMGNTGYSFGTHLHFEIHEGYWNYGKTNAVNPRKYVNF